MLLLGLLAVTATLVVRPDARAAGDPGTTMVTGKLRAIDDPEATYARAKAAGATAATVFPPDDRFYVTDTTRPGWRTMAHLILVDDAGEVEGECSGVMLSFDVVLTAAHCLYNGGLWEGGILVAPGDHPGPAPFGVGFGFDMGVPKGWVSGVGQFDPDGPVPPSPYDYAIVQLETHPWGDRLGPYLAVANVPDSYLRRADVALATAGFPGDKPFATMWATSTYLGSVDATYLYTDLDIAPGQSGSPIFTLSEADGVGYIFSVVSGGNAYFNRSVRFTAGVVSALHAFCEPRGCSFDYRVISEAPPPTPTARPATPTPVPTPMPTPTAVAATPVASPRGAHHVAAVVRGGNMVGGPTVTDVSVAQFLRCVPADAWDALYTWSAGEQRWLAWFGASVPAYVNRTPEGRATMIPRYSGVYLLMNGRTPANIVLLDSGSSSCS